MQLKSTFRENEAHFISFKFLILKLIILFLSGSIFSLAFPAYSISFLGWIGVIPLYLFIKDLRCYKSFLYGFVWGYGWAIASFFWLRSIEPFIPYVMGLVLAMFPAVWAFLVSITRKNILIPNPIRLLGYTESKKYLIENRLHFKKVCAVLVFSAFWCFLEWTRSWIFTGLPWNYLAVTQYQHPIMIQISSCTGNYGVSFVVIFTNIAIAEFIISLFNSIKYKLAYYIPLVIYAALFIIILNAAFGYLAIRKFNNSKTEDIKLKALLVQGDIPQIRYYSAQQAMDALTVYSKYSEKLLSKKPDILIWPESAVPQPLFSGDFLSLEYRSTISNLIQKYHVPILLGTIYYYKSAYSEDYNAYNSAVYINREDKLEAVYNKIHLVPWGEYTPGENTFPLNYIYPWIKDKFGMGRSLTPGNSSTIFNIKDGIRASVLICFEDSYSYIARRHVLNGSNLLITITNDAWFPDTNEPSQHLAEAVFRSVETRRTMIRSGNNSGTCIINPLGIITESIFSEQSGDTRILLPDKQGRGAVIFDVPVNKNPPLSFYTKYGDKFILLMNLIALFGLIWGFLQWKERKMKLYSLITKA
ncbi:MAG TPA: apolipoprotein N-acyltransferase [Lentisphaeria bacterium]|nr:MAG: apolipoprotein N-acyltransferase [Lentisphaerae bacterium GWF2_38_69]HBM16837.1 apolipoprotein N-acyltransferase [Lentisphaeria bacterium]